MMWRYCCCGSRRGPKTDTELCRWILGGLTAHCRSGSAIAYCAFVYCGEKEKQNWVGDTALPSVTHTLVSPRPPCQQYSLILLQLFHEGRVGLGDGAPLLHIVEGRVQIPAVLFHGVSDHGGGRAAHSHLTVD